MPSGEKDLSQVQASLSEFAGDGNLINANSTIEAAEKPQTELDSAAQALIGHHLRTLYGEIVREPVPDQFLKLLQDLERREQE